MPTQDYDSDCVERKMKKLSEEGGRDHEQMVAIAINMCREDQDSEASVEETAGTPAEDNVAETVATQEDVSTNGSQPESPAPEPVLPTETIAETLLTTTMQRDGRPAIPFAPGLTADSFVTEDGTRPTFVELKIAEIGKVSQQNYLYDEPLVNAIEQQIMFKRPGGIFGHPKPDEADTAFPDPDVHWVGAARQGNILWGKAWVRQMAAARRVQDTKRVGGSLTTSIWGKAQKVFKDGAVQLRNFNLERVDFAPMERAAAPMDGAFEVVYQMVDGREANVTVEEIKAALAGLHPDVVTNILPKPVMEHISEIAARAAGQQNTEEMQQYVSGLTTDLNAATTQIAEMAGQIKDKDARISELTNSLFQHDIDATVKWATDWNVASDLGKQRIKGLRAFLRTGLVREMRPNEPLKDAMLRVMEDPAFASVVEMTKEALGGGALIGQQNDNRAPAEVARPTEDMVKDAQARTGIR